MRRVLLTFTDHKISAQPTDEKVSGKFFLDNGEVTAVLTDDCLENKRDSGYGRNKRNQPRKKFVRRKRRY